MSALIVNKPSGRLINFNRASCRPELRYKRKFGIGNFVHHDKGARSPPEARLVGRAREADTPGNAAALNSKHCSPDPLDPREQFLTQAGSCYILVNRMENPLRECRPEGRLYSQISQLRTEGNYSGE
jgi:hypothetical protein